MNEELLTLRDRRDLMALLDREVSYVGISSAPGKRARALKSKLLAMDARPKVKNNPVSEFLSSVFNP